MNAKSVVLNASVLLGVELEAAVLEAVRDINAKEIASRTATLLRRNVGPENVAEVERAFEIAVTATLDALTKQASLHRMQKRLRDASPLFERPAKKNGKVKSENGNK